MRTAPPAARRCWNIWSPPKSGISTAWSSPISTKTTSAGCCLRQSGLRRRSCGRRFRWTFSSGACIFWMTARQRRPLRKSSCGRSMTIRNCAAWYAGRAARCAACTRARRSPPVRDFPARCLRPLSRARMNWRAAATTSLPSAISRRSSRNWMRWTPG